MSQPYDGSVLRIFRRYASLYGVKLKDHNRSVYQKVAKYTQLELF